MDESAGRTDMTCVECQRTLVELEDTAALRDHLESCPECQGLAAELEANRSALASMRFEPLENAALSAVRARVLSELRDSRSVWPGLVRYGAAAAAVLVAVGSLALWKATKIEPLSIHPAPLRTELPNVETPVTRTAVIHSASHKPRRRILPVAQEKHDPLLVKLVTDDPDIVIYWITD
jgi:hypothetical protein